MLLTTPEIVWHNKEPIFSVDFHRNEELWRLATGGADHTVKVWKVTREDGKVKMLFLSSLERHSKAVNAVRFAPDGSLLASGGDDCVICLWKLSTSKEVGNLTNDGDSLEHWTVTKMLRGHVEDVYDLSWSADSKHLISGSVDNTAIVWNTHTGDKLNVLSDSRHYIQGVSWDPCGLMLATLSSDRTMHVYGSRSEDFKCLHTVSRFTPAAENSAAKQSKMFLDETISSFFRRLSFSPEGSLLIAPGGRIETEEDGVRKTTPVVWVFTKTSLPKPVMYLLGPGKPSLVVRFCPVLFELRADYTNPPLIGLPYRMVFAVATLDKVLLYDTQQQSPIALVGDIHYTSLTDLAWSSDGLVLAVSSSDGYCSLVGFEPGELGEPLQQDKLPTCMQHTTTSSTSSSDKDSLTQNNSSPSINVIVPRRIRPAPVQTPSSTIFDQNSSEEPISSPPPPQAKDDTTSKKPRRIQLVPVTKIDSDLPTMRVQPLPTDSQTDSMSSSSVNGEPSATTESSIDKTPRRVPFVTISSKPPSPPKKAVTEAGGGESSDEAMDVE